MRNVCQSFGKRRRDIEEDNRINSPCDEEETDGLPVDVVPRQLAHVCVLRGLKGHELASR